MADYDDLKYNRSEDDDDDWNDNEEKGDEDLGKSKNRISFEKDYSMSEQIAIDTKINRILKEMTDMGVGSCSFKLNDEISCSCHMSHKGWSSTSKLETHLRFRYRDHYDGYCHSDYSAKVLFITKYENEIKEELLKSKEEFFEGEMSALDIIYTREDGIDTICKAYKAGAKIDISKFLELPDLTEKEMLTFVEYGFGYDLVVDDKTPDEVIKRISRKLLDSWWFDPDEETHISKIKEWILNNPSKCILKSERYPKWMRF